MALTCSNCGNELPDNARFCSACGTTVAVEEKNPDCCANCFNELSENAKFCLQCGNPAVVAAAYVSPPEHDEAIRNKLEEESPRQINYRAYDIAHKVWEERGREWEEPKLNTNEIMDFDKNEATLAVRAHKWMEYLASGMERIHWFQAILVGGARGAANDAWTWERYMYRTNKPNHHKALFYKNFIEQYDWLGLHSPFAITYDDPPQPTELFIKYLRNVRGYTDEDMAEFELKMPDMEEFDRWPQKDDELFPPPQPIEVEAAAGIVHFTTDEAVVFVYLDCIYKGKEIALQSVRDEELYVSRKAIIIERTYNNNPICVAIFDPILFATDGMKNKEKVINQLKVELSGSWIDDASNATPEETRKLNSDTVLRFNQREEVILFKGHVTQIDWRGRRGKVEQRWKN